MSLRIIASAFLMTGSTLVASHSVWAEGYVKSHGSPTYSEGCNVVAPGQSIAQALAACGLDEFTEYDDSGHYTSDPVSYHGHEPIIETQVHRVPEIRVEKVPVVKRVYEQHIERIPVVKRVEDVRIEKIPVVKRVYEHRVEKVPVVKRVEVPIIEKVPVIKRVEEIQIQKIPVIKKVYVPQVVKVPVKVVQEVPEVVRSVVPVQHQSAQVHRQVVPVRRQTAHVQHQGVHVLNQQPHYGVQRVNVIGQVPAFGAQRVPVVHQYPQVHRQIVPIPQQQFVHRQPVLRAPARVICQPYGCVHPNAHFGYVYGNGYGYGYNAAAPRTIVIGNNTGIRTASSASATINVVPPTSGTGAVITAPVMPSAPTQVQAQAPVVEASSGMVAMPAANTAGGMGQSQMMLNSPGYITNGYTTNGNAAAHFVQTSKVSGFRSND